LWPHSRREGALGFIAEQALATHLGERHDPELTYNCYHKNAEIILDTSDDSGTEGETEWPPPQQPKDEFAL
jgi:hypothetical protein